MWHDGEDGPLSRWTRRQTKADRYHLAGGEQIERHKETDGEKNARVKTWINEARAGDH